MRIRSPWFALAIALLATTACGNPNQLTGDIRFPVQGAHLLRIGPENGKPRLAEVYLTEPDVDCGTLQAWEATVETGQPGPRPFKQGVVLAWFDVGNPGYEIGNSQATPSLVNSAAEWLVGEVGGSIAISGAIGVGSDSPTHVSGTFDTKTLEANDYGQFVSTGGFVDGSGNPHWPDGGPVSSLKLSGSFGADACP